MEHYSIVFYFMVVVWLSNIGTNYILYPNSIHLSKLDILRCKSHISILHSIAVSIACVITFLVRIELLDILISMWSLSYFSIDLLYIIYELDYIFMIHHLLSISAIINCAYVPNHYPLLNICLFTELSTPLLYRWKLSKLLEPNKQYQRFKEFGIIFWLIRPIYLLCISVIYLDPNIYSNLSIIFYYILVILNILWGIYIIQIGLTYQIK